MTAESNGGCLVRAAEAEDAEAISALLLELDHPASAAEVKERLASVRERDPRGHVLVAEREGRVLGLVTTHLTPVLHRPGDVGRITSLVVTHTERGRGVGRLLMKDAEALLIAAGASRIELTSRADRHDAHAFYDSLGYRLEGVRLAKDLTS